MIATLGRRDQLVADGTLDHLLQSLARFSERLRVVERVRAASVQAVTTRAWGPALVFGRLWESQGLPAMLRARAGQRPFEFDVERSCFALALQRLCAPGSDLQGAAWVRTVECPGFAALDLQHLYRTVGWLAQVRAELHRHAQDHLGQIRPPIPRIPPPAQGRLLRSVDVLSPKSKPWRSCSTASATGSGRIFRAARSRPSRPPACARLRWYTPVVLSTEHVGLSGRAFTQDSIADEIGDLSYDACAADLLLSSAAVRNGGVSS